MANRQRYLLWSAVCLIALPLGYSAAQESKKSGPSPLPQGEFSTELNGLKLWFKVSGTGPVCLMPTPAWGPSSDLYFRTLTPLEKSFTIVYLDSRGTGRSQPARSTKDYTWENLVADLDALRIHLKQEKVWLMGHSEGGMQTLHYVCQHPERVRGLVLLEASAVADEQAQKDTMSRIQLRRDQPWFPEAIKALQELRPEMVKSDADMKAAIKTVLPFYWSDPARITTHEQDFEATNMSVTALRGRIDSQRFPFDLRGRLQRLTVPALIVVGDDDFICSPLAAKRLHLCLPNSKFLLVEGAGHFPWLEQPDAFFGDVRVFLEALNAVQKL